MAKTFERPFDFAPHITKAVIQGEQHTIPTDPPHDIYLHHIPRQESPSTVLIPGYAEVSDEPGPGEFQVHYTESDGPSIGRISFNASDAGQDVSVDYHACGTVIWAEDTGDGRPNITELQVALEQVLKELETLLPLPVSQLKRAQAAHSPTNWRQTFAVHQYAFGSPNLSVDGRRWSHMPLRLNTSATNEVVPILAVQDTATAQTITWDYLTASGHPRVWAEVDGRGEIVSIWEAEDPADPDFPDEPPFDVSRDEGGDPIPGRVVIPLLAPDEWTINAVRDRLLNAPRGQWVTRSRFVGFEEPVGLHRAMVDEQLRERRLEIPDDIRAVFTDIHDYDRRHWYLQLWLRQASRLLHDHRPSTLIPLYREMCRVDRRTGRLVLR